MIELIEPDPTGESLYRDWIPDAADGVRLHHLGFLVRSDADFRAAVAQLEAAGYPTAHSGSFGDNRSEEHTSELQSLMRNSYAVFCLKKKIKINKLQNEKYYCQTM